MPDEPYHTVTSQVTVRHQQPPTNRAPTAQYLPGHKLRCKARDNGAQDSFQARWYPGQESYQPVDRAPVDAPVKQRLPDALVPGKRKAVYLACDEARAQSQGEARTAAVKKEGFELEAHESRTEPGRHVLAAYTTPLRTAASPCPSSMARDFGHLVCLIAPSPTAAPSPAPQADDEDDDDDDDFTYLRAVIASGCAAASSTPTPTPTPTHTPPPSPSTPATSPLTSFDTHTALPTAPSTPPPLPPKPRAYRVQLPIESRVGGEEEEPGSGL